MCAGEPGVIATSDVAPSIAAGRVMTALSTSTCENPSARSRTRLSRSRPTLPAIVPSSRRATPSSHRDRDVTELHDGLIAGGGGECVGHHDAPIRRGGEGEAHHGVLDVQTVGDELDRDVRAREGRARETGRARAHRLHCVVQVGDCRRAGGEPALGLGSRWPHCGRARRSPRAERHSAMRSSAPGSSGAMVMNPTSGRSRRRPRSSRSGARRSESGCVPARCGDKKGPSR